MEHNGDSATRLDRVETEVTTIRSEMAGIKADVRALGDVLNRIENGVAKAQDRADHREDRSRPNLVAIISILITIILTLVSGAWFVGGALSKLEERSEHSRAEAQRMWAVMDRNEKRTYDQRAQQQGVRGDATD